MKLSLLAVAVTSTVLTTLAAMRGDAMSHAEEVSLPPKPTCPPPSSELKQSSPSSDSLSAPGDVDSDPTCQFATLKTPPATPRKPDVKKVLIKAEVLHGPLNMDRYNLITPESMPFSKGPLKFVIESPDTPFVSMSVRLDTDVIGTGDFWHPYMALNIKMTNLIGRKSPVWTLFSYYRPQVVLLQDMSFVMLIDGSMFQPNLEMTTSLKLIYVKGDKKVGRTKFVVNHLFNPSVKSKLFVQDDKVMVVDPIQRRAVILDMAIVQTSKMDPMYLADNELPGLDASKPNIIKGVDVAQGIVVIMNGGVEKIFKLVPSAQGVSEFSGPGI